MVEDLINVLEFIEDVTQLFEIHQTATTQDVEIFTASIIERLDYQINKPSSISSIAKILISDILSRRRQLYNQFPIIELVAHASTFLTPQYKSSTYWNYLCTNSVYLMSTERTIGVLFKLSCFFSKPKSEATAGTNAREREFTAPSGITKRELFVKSTVNQMEETRADDASKIKS